MRERISGPAHPFLSKWSLEAASADANDGGTPCVLQAAMVRLKAVAKSAQIASLRSPEQEGLAMSTGLQTAAFNYSLDLLLRGGVGVEERKPGLRGGLSLRVAQTPSIPVSARESLMQEQARRRYEGRRQTAQSKGCEVESLALPVPCVHGRKKPSAGVEGGKRESQRPTPLRRTAGQEREQRMKDC